MISFDVTASANFWRCNCFGDPTAFIHVQEEAFCGICNAKAKRAPKADPQLVTPQVAEHAVHRYESRRHLMIFAV